MKLNQLIENDDNEDLLDGYQDDSDASIDNSKAGYDSVQEIRAVSYPYFEHQIEKLNRRATKLGTPPIQLNIIETFFKNVEGENSAIQKKEKYVKVEITGEAPHVPGYDFLATIEHKGGGNIVRTVPGVDASKVKEFYDAKPEYCDHCKKKRYRIDTFIIRDQKTGNLRQIGRNCLSDFLGGRDPKAMLFWFALRDELNALYGESNRGGGEDEGGRNGRNGRRVEYAASPETILSVAAPLIQHYGYIKYGGDNIPTSGMVRQLVFQGRPVWDEGSTKLYDEWAGIVKAGAQQGKLYTDTVVNWFNSLPQSEKDNNNFYHSIEVLLKGDDVNPRDVGYLTAIFPAYERYKGNVAQKESKSNEWIGTVGAKLPPTRIKVVNTTFIPNRNAYNAPDIQLCKMEDDAGNSYTWWNSSSTTLDRDASYTIVGTIKKHDEYHNRKTTTLTRVKAAPV